MTLAVRFVLTLVLTAAAVFAFRRARPAVSPYGRRMAWIGFLLAVQLGVLYGFVALLMRAPPSAASVVLPGLLFFVQALRVALLIVAAGAWFGLVRGELTHAWQLPALALCVVLLGWGGGGAPLLATLALGVGLARTKWIEELNGWRRAVGLVGSVTLLVALSIVPVVSLSNGSASLQLTPTPHEWPPALLASGPSARTAAELALIRPLDRGAQALIDLLRIQLLVVTIKLLFLPIRLAGMSLKRRFTINYILVRSIPAFLTGLIIVGLVYLMLGYRRLDQVRAEFDHTLARAGTVAEALAQDPLVRRGTVDVTRLAAATGWMGDDGRIARILVRTAGLADSAGDGDSTFARGLLLTDHTLALVARRHADTGPSVEVLVPVDSSYLARIMRPIGGNLTVRAEPHVFVGASGIRVDGDTAWTPRGVAVTATDPRGGSGGRWFLGRTYVPVGDWNRTTLHWRGAVELGLSTTPRSLFTSLLASLGGLYAGLPTLLILIGAAWLVSMVEGFAVRSGRSIVEAVIDEAVALRSAAERIGSGDLDYRLPVRGRDEFSVVATSFNDMAANLKRQREELIAAERMEEELVVAREIQQRLLPQEPPRVSGLDVAGASRPSREVGGDLFYWFAHEGGTLGLTLGDVSGKGVPAALLMSNVLAALRAQALLRVDPAESVGRLNQLIAGQIEPGRFVTLFYGEVDASEGVLRYASAGHNPPLLVRRDAGVEWLREGGVPLGVLSGATYCATTVRFDPGDTLIVYSDGVTEAEGRASGAPGDAAATRPLFGEERLATAAQTLRGTSARATLDGILEAVQTFASGASQADDITIVVVRRA